MHVMVIPDGDRRYARREGIPLSQSYAKAADMLRSLVRWMLVDKGIDVFTFFGLSYANLARRSRRDLAPILAVQTKTLNQFTHDPLFHEHGIRVTVHGERRLLPNSYRQAIRKLEHATQDYREHQFHLLLGYSGSRDLLGAIRKTVAAGQRLTWKNIIAQCSLNQPIDYLIRTADEKRISDGPWFLMAYTEFAYLPKFFPELTRQDVFQLLAEFARRHRTFGV